MRFFNRHKRESKPVQSPKVPLTTLPADILVLIFGGCDTSTIHSLRKTCRGLRRCIDGNIRSIVPAVAKATFPVLPNRIKESTSSTGIPHDLQWLHELRFRWMAAVLVEQPGHGGPSGGLSRAIPADDPAGDGVRDLVMSGLKVLHRLYLIDKNINQYPDLPNTEPAILNLANSVSRRLDRATATLTKNQERLDQAAVPDHLVRREEKIIHHRVELIKTLPIEHLEGFNTLITLLASSGGWTSPGSQGIRYHIDAIDGGFSRDAKHFTKGRSWLFWWVMHTGPGLFLNQWLALDSLADREVSWVCVAGLRNRSSRQIDLERDAGQRVSKAIALRLSGGLDENTALWGEGRIVEASRSAAKDKNGRREFAFTQLPFKVDWGDFRVENRKNWYKRES